MTPKQTANAINSITKIFNSTLGSASGLQASLVGMVASKLYEAKVLAELLNLLEASGYHFRVVNGAVCLKAAPGPINTSYSYIELLQNNVHVANIWTDVEFVGLSSFYLTGLPQPSARGEYHELDILVCDPNAITRPRSNQVFIGVEAKHWAHIPKKLLREILGVRRELSFVDFRSGRPSIAVRSLKNLQRSNPASHLVFAYSTVYPHGSGPVTEWAVPAKEFEIDLWPISV
ncbi:hypothetical protein [Limnohabitans planktonicus]|uniref:hypothetical protein n=1 Tax=Limnohabitans planktonicus TaxID=540060 RepID=UPI000ACEA15D|nr:hypothetical protein [Limnohabitans planktonicus]